MNDRAFRSLSLLQNSGATSRVLNLHRLQAQYGDDAEHLASPLFKDARLNRAIIVKYRLREAERDLFDDYRASATKLILPIDGQDLRSGGRYVFIGQRGYDAILTELLGERVSRIEDRKTLDLLSRIPSFDPFLLREHLKRHDIVPAPSYFDISPGDLKRMFAFIEAELRALVGMSVSTADTRIGASTATLVQKILSNTAVDDMQPLRLVLRLRSDQYVEGVFCWKGFLYYKWKLGELTARAPDLIKQIRAASPLGRADFDTKLYIAEVKDRIGDAIVANCCAVAELLKVYDRAYARLTQAGEPAAFRDFLLKAPHMFVQLGEQLGVIDHIAGFWAHRFPPGRKAAAGAEELADILADFEDSLGLTDRDRNRVLLAS